MAHLEVKPKKYNPWWLWLLIILIALAILFLLLKGCNKGTGSAGAGADTTAADSGIADTAARHAAVTTNDWETVDFNSPASTDPDITDKDVTVSGNNKYTIYSLGEDILFATDKNTLQPGAESKLKQISSALSKRFKGAVIGVFGSTDSTGTAGHNKQLGADRANAVKDWLIKSGGIEEGKISVHTLGETQPVASNATPGGRKQNRNVSIVALQDTTAAK